MFWFVFDFWIVFCLKLNSIFGSCFKQSFQDPALHDHAHPALRDPAPHDPADPAHHDHVFGQVGQVN